MKKTYLLLVSLLFSANLSVNAQTFQWVKRWGLNFGTPAMIGWDVAPDKFGGAYLSQRIRGVQDLDYGPGVVNSGTNNIDCSALMRYSSGGAYKWSFVLPNTAVSALKVVPDELGNFYAAGRYYGTVDFDPGAGSTVLTTTTTEMFVAKYDSNMVFKWVKEFKIIGGSGSPYILFSDIAISGTNDKIYLALSWKGVVDLDPGTPTVSASSASTTIDAAIVKLDSAGNYGWSQVTWSNGNEETWDMCVDNANNKLLVTGVYAGACDIFGINMSSVANSNDVFFTSLNASNGTTNFSKGFGGTGKEIPHGIEATAGGQILITGEYESTVDFNPDAPTNNYSVNNFSDPFIARYNGVNGGYIWAKPLPGSGYDISYDMDLDNNKNIWLGMYTTACVDTDPSAATNFQCSSIAGLPSMVLVKLDSAANFISSFDISGTTGSYSTTAVRLIGLNCSPLDNSVYVCGEFRGSNIDFDPSASTAFISAACPPGNFNTDSFFSRYLSCAGTPTVPGNISGNITVCQTSSQSYSIAPVSGATSYSWALPGGWTGSSSTNSISVTAGASSGNISVYAVNSCGNSPVKTVSVTVTPVPAQPLTISAPSLICSSSSGTYSVALVTGATSYVWSLPAGWSGSSSTNSISATPGGSGIFTVTANNACGASPQRTLNVTVNTAPVITVNSGSICSGSSFTMVAGGASTYTFSSGPIVSPLVNTAYSVTGTSAAGCVGSNTAISTVSVNATPTITLAGSNICTGGSFTLNPSGASTYTFSNGPVVSPTSTSSYTVTGSSTAGCTSSAVATVSVSTSLTVTITGSNTICSGQPLNLTANGASTYTWNTSATTTSITATPTANTTYSVTGSSGSCSNSALFSVTVNPLPTLSVSSSTTQLCINSSATLSASGGSTYTWSPGGPGTTIIISPTVTTSYTVLGTDSNGCTNSNTITQVVINCSTTELGKTELNETLKIFPNPFNNKIFLIGNNKKQLIEIYNSLGSLIYTSEIGKEELEIDLLQQPNGIYIIKAGTTTKKLVKN